jgi:hypothetical protein
MGGKAGQPIMASPAIVVLGSSAAQEVATAK